MAYESGERSEATENEAAEAILALGKAVLAELAQAREELEAKDTPYLRRAYVRAVFAAIAGAVEFMRLFARQHPDNFTPGELALLQETRPDLDQNGNVVERKNKSPADAELLFAYRAWTKTFGAEFALRGDENWSNFKKGARIRDRITHPKSAADFDLSEEDVLCVEAIAEWLGERMISGMIGKIPPGILIGVAIGLLILTRNEAPFSAAAST
jgi:hypothetical protein